MEPVNRTSEDLRGLVNDLDTKLADRRDRKRFEIPAGDDGLDQHRVPSWLAMSVVIVLGIAIGFVVVRPWQERCTYSREFCAIAQLDIDALRVTIPESQIIAVLPNIDALDPNDELTAGDIFAMERFADVNFEELLTDDEVNRLLRSRSGP